MCFKIPCSKLVQDVITTLGLTPFLIMPSAWRLLNAIDVLSSRYNIGITVANLRNNYSTGSTGRERIVFRIRDGRMPLVSAHDIGDVIWNSA